MMLITEKQPNLSLNLGAPSEITQWFQDLTAEEQDATDKILDHLNQAGGSPNVNTKGDIIEIITAIVQSLKQVIADHLLPTLKILTDYIARWLCQYFEQTNAATIQISFGFNAKIPERQDA